MGSEGVYVQPTPEVAIRSASGVGVRAVACSADVGPVHLIMEVSSAWVSAFITVAQARGFAEGLVALCDALEAVA
jgi:hypothetical protein